MKKNIILSVVCGMVAMASLTSCNDFLQVSATSQKEMDKSFTTYDELRLAILGTGRTEKILECPG